MRPCLILFGLSLASFLTGCGHSTYHRHAAVVPHEPLRSFSMNGNTIRGIATPGQGVAEFEAWRTSIAPGSRTPVHSHDSEEIFVILQGQGEAIIGDQTIEFWAPCTVIAPANVPHQIVNTGKEETDAIVIVGAGSGIYDKGGQLMDLPWRK